LWADNKPDWKEFVRVAKETDTKVIIIQCDRFDEEILESGEQDSGTPSADFRKYIGKVGQLILFWIRDGVKYTYPITTTWWDEWMSTQLPEQEIPSEIKKKSPEELSKEFADYMEQEHPELVGHSYLPESITSGFWKKKGLEIHRLEDDEKQEEISEKVKSAERLGIELWDQIVREKESKTLPRLIEECDEWARENGLTVLSSSNLEAFLDEKEEALRTSASHEAIRRKVNLLLKRMSQKEKQILPRLVKECTEWTKAQGISRATQSHIAEFLDETEKSLSLPARKILFRNVVISLKRQ